MKELLQHLRNERLKQGLSIGAVSAKAGLSSGVLNALENGKHSQLGPPDIIHHYLRAYCRALGMDFLSQSHLTTEKQYPVRNHLAQVKHHPQPRTSLRRLKTVMIILFTSAILVTFYGLIRHGDNKIGSLKFRDGQQAQQKVPLKATDRNLAIPNHAANSASPPKSAAPIVPLSQEKQKPPASLDHTPAENSHLRLQENFQQQGLPEKKSTGDQSQAKNKVSTRLKPKDAPADLHQTVTPPVDFKHNEPQAPGSSTPAPSAPQHQKAVAPTVSSQEDSKPPASEASTLPPAAPSTETTAGGQNKGAPAASPDLGEAPVAEQAHIQTTAQQDHAAATPESPPPTDQSLIPQQGSSHGISQEANPVAIAEDSQVHVHHFRVQAIEKCWVEVRLENGKKPEGVLLQPGESREWEVKGAAQVLLGNAGGVRLSWDGRAMGTAGKSGSVARLNLPPSDVAQ